MRRNLSSKTFVGSYRYRFCGSKLNYFSIWGLAIWVFPYEELGIDPLWTKYTFFLTTLDGPASILRSKQSMNFLYSIILMFQMGSGFSLFREMRLLLSKIYPSVIELIRKIYFKSMHPL